MYTGNVALYADGVRYQSFDDINDDVLRDYFNTYGRMIVLEDPLRTPRYVPVVCSSDSRQPPRLFVDGDYVPCKLTPEFSVAYKACVVARTCQSPGSCTYDQWFEIHFKDICLYTMLPLPGVGATSAGVGHQEYANYIYEDITGYYYHIGNMTANATHVTLANQSLTLNTNSAYGIRIATMFSQQCIPFEYCIPTPQYGSFYTDGEYCEISRITGLPMCDWMWSC